MMKASEIAPQGRPNSSESCEKRPTILWLRKRILQVELRLEKHVLVERYFMQNDGGNNDAAFEHGAPIEHLAKDVHDVLGFYDTGKQPVRQTGQTNDRNVNAPTEAARPSVSENRGKKSLVDRATGDREKVIQSREASKKADYHPNLHHEPVNRICWFKMWVEEREVRQCIQQ